MPRIKNIIPNESDDLHCLQSCVRMILSTEGHREVSLSEAEEITGYQQGKQTWPYDTMLSFAARDFNVLTLEDVDQELFVRDPAAAMKAEYGEEVWSHILKVSDVERAQKSAIACVANTRIKFEKRIPRLSDIKTLLAQEWWIVVNVNARQLAHREGYNGHFVIVDEINEKEVVLQNPGLPAVRDQRITTEDFLSAWYCPSEKASNILAIKKQ